MISCYRDTVESLYGHVLECSGSTTCSMSKFSLRRMLFFCQKAGDFIIPYCCLWLRDLMCRYVCVCVCVCVCSFVFTFVGGDECVCSGVGACLIIYI